MRSLALLPRSRRALLTHPRATPATRAVPALPAVLLGILLLVAGLAAPAHAGPAVPVTAASSAAPAASAATPASYVKGVVRATNKRRVKHDRKKLKTNRCLARAARQQARMMAATGVLEHQDLQPLLGRCDLSQVGENIAYGYPTPGAVVKAWMRSPGHRANILRRSFRLLGVGAVQDDSGTWWVAQVFGRR